MSKAKRITFISIAALIIIFFAQNAETVDTRLFFWKVSMPRAFWLGLILALGFAAGYLTRVFQDLNGDENQTSNAVKKGDDF
jgi:uncharacterized integral membrane protein